jgi:hypothetical protein
MITMGRRRVELRSVNPSLSQPTCGPSQRVYYLIFFRTPKQWGSSRIRFWWEYRQHSFRCMAFVHLLLNFWRIPITQGISTFLPAHITRNSPMFACTTDPAVSNMWVEIILPLLCLRYMDIYLCCVI